MLFVTIWISRCHTSSLMWSPASEMSFRMVVTYHSRSLAYFSAMMAIFSTSSSRMARFATAR